MQIKFDHVQGYATYDDAVKRGENIADLLEKGGFMSDRSLPRWLVVPCFPKGKMRFVPAFYCGNVMGGPSPFLGLTNVCCFN